jgi:hypothetical protein
MNLIERLNKIGEQIKVLLNNETEQKLSYESTLMDGSPVSFEPEMAVGATVMVTTPDGVINGEGSYTLADGSTFEAVGGIVTVMTPMEMKEEVKEDESALAELEKALEANLSKNISEKLTTEFELRLTAANDTITELTAKLESQANIMNDIFEVVKSLTETEPTQKTTYLSKQFSEEKRKINVDLINEALKELKNNKS